MARARHISYHMSVWGTVFPLHGEVAQWLGAHITLTGHLNSVPAATWGNSTPTPGDPTSNSGASRRGTHTGMSPQQIDTQKSQINLEGKMKPNSRY